MGLTNIEMACSKKVRAKSSYNLIHNCDICSLINCTKIVGPRPLAICAKPLAHVSAGKVEERVLVLISSLWVIPWYMSVWPVTPANSTHWSTASSQRRKNAPLGVQCLHNQLGLLKCWRSKSVSAVGMMTREQRDFFGFGLRDMRWFSLGVLRPVRPCAGH